MLALVVSLSTLPGFRPVTASQIVVAPIMERMANAFRGISSLRAMLSQHKTYGQLGISDPVEQGVLFIKRKGDRDIQVRIEIKQPAQRVITVKDDHYVLFQPAINQAIEGSVNKTLGAGGSGAGFLTYFFGGLTQAARDYNIVALGDEMVNGRRATHLRLTPHSARKGLYRQIDLWVDNKLWVPTQQQVVETNQDVTLVQLVEIQVNVDLPDKLFTQKLPRDVQRVRS
jgi:outer membrane lipoprotein-sorting protein